MDLVVRVPGFPRDAHLTAAGGQCWARYERDLADYEEWHVQIAVKGAGELLSAVRASEYASYAEPRGCPPTTSQMVSYQREFDSVTEHRLAPSRAFQ